MMSSIRRLLVILAVMSFALFSLLVSGATGIFHWNDDPDLPSFSKGGGEAEEIDKEEYMTRRAEAIAQKRGISKDAPFDPQARPTALRQMELQEKSVVSMPKSHARDSLLAPWIP